MIPLVEKGELDLALVSRDLPRHGTLLFHEPLVWVGSAQFQAWRRDPLPIAVYESTSLAKSQILQQASTAMLAQANASKQGVLQLLQG